MAETVVEQDDDVDTVGSDDDGINWEFDNDALGGFIANQLQDKVNEELGFWEGKGDVMAVEYYNKGAIHNDGMVLDS
jgi:hypothetical protein